MCSAWKAKQASRFDHALISDFRLLRTQLVVHAAGGLLVLLATTALSVYKPWGKTRYARH